MANMSPLEVCAVLLTIGMFMTNTSTLLQFVRARSTGHSSTMPFVATLINCALWLRYGILMQMPALILPNTIGVTMAIVSLYTFCVYTDRKSGVHAPIMLAILFLYIVFLYVHYAYSSAIMEQYGFLTAAFSVVMYGAPLFSLAKVIQFKTATGLISFPMTCISMVVCGAWTIVGYKINNPFVIVPNFVGGILCILQMLVFYIYRNGVAYTPHSSSLPMSLLRND
ncbi:hypothetical protein BASA81_013919 [Batrachochytrium salamandrivorans]|nr:hypothetical protein BASA81_013919 [Batrachochytrium salamandrivorans]